MASSSTSVALKSHLIFPKRALSNSLTCFLQESHSAAWANYICSSQSAIRPRPCRLIMGGGGRLGSRREHEQRRQRDGGNVYSLMFSKSVDLWKKQCARLKFTGRSGGAHLWQQLLTVPDWLMVMTCCPGLGATYLDPAAAICLPPAFTLLSIDLIQNNMFLLFIRHWGAFNLVIKWTQKHWVLTFHCSSFILNVCSHGQPEPGLNDREESSLPLFEPKIHVYTDVQFERVISTVFAGSGLGSLSS